MFHLTNGLIGWQAVADTSTTQQHPLGTRALAYDPDYGEVELIYLLGLASTAVGEWVIYSPDDYSTALMTANSEGSVAVSMSANVASQYGWYCIKGKVPGLAATGFADNADVYATSTAGTVDDAEVDGDRVTGALGASAVSGGLADFELDNPVMLGAEILGSTEVTATATELNILDGVTSTTAELNILDGVTSTTAELNILDGVTSTAAELNILDGVTSTAAELNILDGVTATAAELNNAADVSARVEELTVTGAVTAGVQSVELNHTGTIIEATIADAANHQGLFVVKDTSATGTAAHTLTLTSGTFNGTNNVATLNALNECLVVYFDSAGNGTIVENVGSVALS